jgi:hypothetical protein
MLSNTISTYYSDINNINYNSSFLTTYKLHSDDDDRNLCYQLQLLQALNIASYDITILTTHIEKIGYFLQNNMELASILILLQEKYKDTNIAFIIDKYNSTALFQLLFSYEYFDIFHKCLCKYISFRKNDRKNDRKNEVETETSINYFDELKNVIYL